MIPVILSGGSGTRLWPLSRELYPKQFLPLVNEHTLLEDTIKRASSIANIEHLIIVSNEQHRFMVGESLKNASLQIPGSIILEPAAKNTAPAVALAALKALEINKDAVLFVMPSDHMILNADALMAAVKKAEKAASQGKLVTLGIVPESPNTGYGYIKPINQNPELGCWEVERFYEKPTLAQAQSYVESGNYYWNSGMFVFRADSYLKELGDFQPEMLEVCSQCYQGNKLDLDFTRVDSEGFSLCPSDSIDYAVMEKTQSAAVVPMDAGWSDVGSWAALWEIRDKDDRGNVLIGDVLEDNVENSYIHSSGRLVAAVGVKDHIIVETDDAVLVADKSKVQEIKKIVELLKANQRPERITHKKVYRPWGNYESVSEGPRFQVKRIIVNPGATLSLQKHHHRSEHWVVVQGTALVTRGEDEELLSENQSTYIPVGVVHRLANPGTIPLEVIEVQTGSYLGEDDIVRYDDKYGRC